jgi:hypothetical protein
MIRLIVGIAFCYPSVKGLNNIFLASAKTRYMKAVCACLEGAERSHHVQVDAEILWPQRGRLHHGRQVNREYWQISKPQVSDLRIS